MTNIEWAKNEDGSKGKTWNPIRARHKETGKVGWYCEHVHEGCTICYAEAQNKTGARGGTCLAYKPGHRKDVDIFLDEKTLLAPLKWRKPQRIFVCSMTDLFGNWVRGDWLDRIFAIMALCPQHTFIILTKRPLNMRTYLSDTKKVRGIVLSAAWTMLGKLPKYKHENVMERPFPLPNVWGLVSCSEQKDADTFIPDLLQTPLVKRGVSLEPLLGPIDLNKIAVPDTAAGKYAGHGYAFSALQREDDLKLFNAPAHLDWVIVGGESGKDARPMHPAWARTIRDQCATVDGVEFFFKQWGSNLPGELLPPKPGQEGTPWRRYPDGSERWEIAEYGKPREELPRVSFLHTGKKTAGRLLDGAEYNATPKAA